MWNNNDKWSDTLSYLFSFLDVLCGKTDTDKHTVIKIGRARLEPYLSNRCSWHHAYANKKVNPGYTNVLCKISIPKYSGLIPNLRWREVNSVTMWKWQPRVQNGPWLTISCVNSPKQYQPIFMSLLLCSLRNTLCSGRPAPFRCLSFTLLLNRPDRRTFTCLIVEFSSGWLAG